MKVCMADRSCKWGGCMTCMHGRRDKGHGSACKWEGRQLWTCMKGQRACAREEKKAKGLAC